MLIKKLHVDFLSMGRWDAFGRCVPNELSVITKTEEIIFHFLFWGRFFCPSV